MGRYVSPQITESNLTAGFTDATTTFDGNGYVTGYVANDTTYSNITYATANGSSANFGGTYRRVTGWTETNNINNSTQTITVNYNALSRVSSLSIT